jgi:hypothetical protein
MYYYDDSRLTVKKCMNQSNDVRSDSVVNKPVLTPEQTAEKTRTDAAKTAETQKSEEAKRVEANK